MPDKRNNHAYGGLALALRAASYSDCHSYRPFSPKLCKTYLTCASRIGWQSPIGARDEATSSENQVVAYACSPSISKHSPPTIYHGQGLACSSHSGSYKSTMSKSKDSVTTQKKNNPRYMSTDATLSYPPGILSYITLVPVLV